MGLLNREVMMTKKLTFEEFIQSKSADQLFDHSPEADLISKMRDLITTNEWSPEPITSWRQLQLFMGSKCQGQYIGDTTEEIWGCYQEITKPKGV